MSDATFQQIAKTFQGLEQVLADELRELGAENIQVLKRAVSYDGDNALLYKANLHLRTAIAVLVPVESFLAEDPEELYRKAMQFPWDSFFRVTNTFSIQSSINSPYFTHTQFASLKLKDAIVDYFRKKTGKRPNIDRENPEFRINLHIHNKEVTLSFDSSGDALFKRGYRQRHSEAPLNEVLAAGMIAMSGYKADRIFVDPMCGSGTLPIEAAMVAMNMPAGYFRREFGFMHWGDFDSELWNSIREAGKEGIRKQLHFPVIGTDIMPENIDKSKRNAHLLRCNALKFGVRDFFDFERPGDGPLHIMINPPYGERLENETDLVRLYKAIGDELKKKYTNGQAWIISSNLDALKHLGLKPSRKITLYNGALECKFECFDLYEGSKKLPKND
jgi:putative N6-adenine-specific DNA methylase